MRYLDENELADMLGMSVATVRRLHLRKPWMLPPPCHTPLLPMRRWREVDVHAWLVETGQVKLGGIKRCHVQNTEDTDIHPARNEQSLLADLEVIRSASAHPSIELIPS